ncbi:unnamed protein product, partial [Heterotrigona itama]
MGRGKRLNPTEIQVILKLNEQHCSVTKIAKTVNRSRKVITNLLKDPDNYGRRKSCGRPQCLTARDKRAIIRLASNSTLTARQIAEEAGITTNVRNVRRLLKNCEHLERRKLQRKPWSKQLKLCRLQFPEEHELASASKSNCKLLVLFEEGSISAGVRSEGSSKQDTRTTIKSSKIC